MSLPACRRIRRYPQLDGSATASRNCGVSAVRTLVTHATRGLIKPTVAQTRKRMGNPSGWTTPLEAERAVTSYTTAARRRGLRPLRWKRQGRWSGALIVSGAGKESLRSAIRRGEAVYLVVHYAKVAAVLPKLVGSRTFRGRHAWVVGGHDGFQVVGNRMEVRVADSLWDGREPGIPNGPQWVPFARLWQVADGAWSDRGGRGWVGGSVPCSLRLAVPAPPPPPDPDDPDVPCEDVIAEHEARIETLEDQLAEARSALAELEGRRIPDALAKRLRRLAADLDAALGPNTIAAGEEPDVGIVVET